MKALYYILVFAIGIEAGVLGHDFGHTCEGPVTEKIVDWYHYDTVFITSPDSNIAYFLLRHGVKYPSFRLTYADDSTVTRIIKDEFRWNSTSENQ